MKDRYAWAVKTAEGKFHGTIEDHGGKFRMRGTVATEQEKNEIWAAIKTIGTWQQEVEADIQVTGGATAGTAPTAPAAPASPRTYTVQPGDTLSKIAKMHLGDANAYMRIFDLNTDQLSDPNKIKPGQVLKIA